MFRRIPSHLAVAIVSVISTALLVGGVAWALQSPVSGGVVHACYNPSTGAVNLKVTAACPTTGNKTPVNWNVAGQTGAPGPSDVYVKSYQSSLALNYEDSDIGVVLVSDLLPAGTYLIQGQTTIVNNSGAPALSTCELRRNGSATVASSGTEVQTGYVQGTTDSLNSISLLATVVNVTANTRVNLTCNGSTDGSGSYAEYSMVTATKVGHVHNT